MRLTEEQVETYRREGFLLVPDVFSARELRRIHAEVALALTDESPAKVLEKDGRTVRGVHGQHKTFSTFDRLVRHPRLLGPAHQILEDRVFVYQFKVNVKAALVGDVWPWHQDFIFWRAEDGLPEPHLVNALVMLDDVTEFNGPVTFFAGSHEEGIIGPSTRSSADSAGAPSWANDVSADLKYTISSERLRDLASRYRIASAKGGAGSVLFFHPNLVHSSANNMSPFDRRVAIITYNRVSNRADLVSHPRPEFMCSRDYTPIEPAGDDALL